MGLMREETFGPVLPIMPFDDVDEAFNLAGDTEYGLGASVYTRDPVLAERAARELRVGGVWVNDPIVDNPAASTAANAARANSAANRVSKVGRAIAMNPTRITRNPDTRCGRSTWDRPTLGLPAHSHGARTRGERRRR